MISRNLTSLLFVVVALVANSISRSEAGSLTAALGLTDSVIVCPDKGQCSDGSTCCLKSDGLYGCCAFKNAVCCPGTKHCCPANTVCQADGCIADQSMLNAQELIKSVTDVEDKKSESVPVSTNEASKNVNLICPDATSCPGFQSCCRTYSGHYNCCPYDFGSCCADGLHCCPSGTRCIGATCVRNNNEDGSALLFIQSVRTQTNN